MRNPHHKNLLTLDLLLSAAGPVIVLKDKQTTSGDHWCDPKLTSNKSLKGRWLFENIWPKNTRYFRKSHDEQHRSRSFITDIRIRQRKVPSRLLPAYFVARLAFHDQDDNYQRDHTEDNPTGLLLSGFTN